MEGKWSAITHQELEFFIKHQCINIAPLAEGFTEQSHMHLLCYAIYSTQHLNVGTHGGTAIIIKSFLKHYELQKYGHINI